jgi:RNA-directed DNA polymerase
MRRHIANAAGGFYVTARSFTPDAEHYAATLPMITLVDGELSTVNETKTSVRDARRERFDFLGYAFGPHHFRKDGRLVSRCQSINE